MTFITDGVVSTIVKTACWDVGCSILSGLMNGKESPLWNGAADKGARPYTQAVHVNHQRDELRARFNSLCRIHAVIRQLFVCLSIYVYPRVHNHLSRSGSSPLIFLKMLSDDGCNCMSLNVSLELLQWHCWVPHHPNKSMVHTHPLTYPSPIPHPGRFFIPEKRQGKS